MSHERKDKVEEKNRGNADGNKTPATPAGLEGWVERTHGEVRYYLSEMLSRHIVYKGYLHKFNYEK